MASSILQDGQLSSFLLAFFTLQNPIDTTFQTDSFHNSQYYLTDYKDICLIITCIAVMAVLRDGLRLLVMEPYAKRKLVREMEHKIATEQKLKVGVNGNGNASAVGTGLSTGSARIRMATGGKGAQNGSANENGLLNVNGVSYQMTRREKKTMHHNVVRFAEQGWSFVYYAAQWANGIYVYRNLPTRFLDPIDMWMGFPHVPLAGPVKFYYLTQLAFYAHQVLILNAEARRKDHYQMMAHHVITITLIIASYQFGFTRAGCLIMVLMDCSDVFLPLAKMLRYLSYRKLCDATFTAFLVSWFLTRHVFFTLAIKSLIYDFPRMVDAKNEYYWTYKPFAALLIALEGIQAVWFLMICRVAWRVISGQGADDSRSDDEVEIDGEDEGKKVQ